MGAPMKADGGTLTTLAGYFALMSLFAIGGANSAVPEMHRLVVDVQHWMTGRQFTDMFALAQLTPGPNVIIVTLIGYHVAGIVGALVTTVAMCGPTCLFAFFVGRTFERFSGATWQVVLSGALVPVSLGLMASSATVVATAADYSRVAAGLSLATAVICYFVRINPLWVFAAADALGLAGVV
jgi:chromate transporter